MRIYKKKIVLCAVMLFLLVGLVWGVYYLESVTDYKQAVKETTFEEINEKIKEFLSSGIDKGDLRGNLKIMPTIFNLWGMLSGLIQFAANKEEYIKKTMGLSKIQFLEHGFYMLYCSIAVNKEE